MRREVEAAEAAEAETGVKKKASRKTSDEKGEGTPKKRASKADKDGAPKKKKAAKPRTRRAKEAMQRRRLVWVVYSSTMREELLATLLGRGKRRYFMQPVKEALNADGTPMISVAMPAPDEDVEEAKIDPEVEVAEDIDIDADIEIEDEAEEGEAEEAEEAAPEV